MKKIIMLGIIGGMVLASLGGCIIVPWYDGHGRHRGDFYEHRR